MFRSINSVFDYIFSFTNLEKSPVTFSKRTYRLDRMKKILDALDNPQKSFESIHIAGTKGKGSTAMLLASAIAESLKKVGLFVSPHVSSPLERIQTPGHPVDRNAFLTAAERIRYVVEEKNLKLEGIPFPTTFELLTALAFLYFNIAGCEFAVIETGIGGRLDATNIIQPIASVITPIDMEHTDILGDTLEKIANEKAGIIKKGTPVFSGYQPKEARTVIEKTAEKMHSTCRFLGDEVESITINRLDSTGMNFSFFFAKGRQEMFRTTLIGRHQAENAALAYTVIRNSMPEIPAANIKLGFEKAELPGRFEFIPYGDITLILDGAHTPLSVQRLLETFKLLYPDKNYPESVLIFGSVLGKNHQAMAEILAPAFNRIIISRPGQFKESEPQNVKASFEKLNKNTILDVDPMEALETAIKDAERGSGIILVTGSFYMVAEIRKLVKTDV